MKISNESSNVLHVLIIEDYEDDALMLVDALEGGGYTVNWLRVDSEKDMQNALLKTWDIVFSDYTMPGFSGSRALQILRETDPDTPFVFVSGTIGEDAAVKAMKAGAQDYVMKGQFARVLPTVERELHEVEMRKERRQIEASRSRLADIIEATPDLVFMLGTDGALHYLNGAARELFSITDESISAYYFADFFPDYAMDKITHDVLPELFRNGVWSGETAIQTNDREIPVSLVMLGHKNGEESVGYLSAIARDITERKLFEKEIQHKATHDALTGLPNRFLLMDRFVNALDAAKRTEKAVGLMFLDLDNFKRVNDSLGHDCGDVLLKICATRIRDALRPVDTVARHGGDEFSIVIGNLDKIEDAVAALRRIQSEFARPVLINNNEVYVTFSTGIALYPHDGESAEDLLRHADSAMYRSKASGPGQYRFYAPAMNERGHELLTLEAELRRAIENSEFFLQYQPQIDLRSGEVVGFESLVRWNHPVRGVIPPSDFIPLLENSGLIISAGEWVFRNACQVRSQWANQGFENIKVSVNVSALQFNDPELLDKFASMSEQAKSSPGSLEIEITENIVMQDPESACKILEALHDLGISIAIDDFGTGYSSMAYLKRFPIDVLKIDRTFINDLGKNASGDAIVEASILLAKKLGLDVVAEGVETTEQLAFLRSHDCDYAQGYYLSPPVDQEKALTFLGNVWRWD